MLPSFNHTLPNGKESGRYLALDVGGSTLRVALIDLFGRESAKMTGDVAMRIVTMRSWKIDEKIKRLEGTLFFDWMAQRMEDMLSESECELEHDGVLEAGLSWSFPVE
jgi:hexokinase